MYYPSAIDIPGISMIISPVNQKDLTFLNLDKS